MTDPDETLEQAHRLLFGRLVGWLFRTTGDLRLAEDAVSTAFVSAIVAWRRDGIPNSPEAWLRVAARNGAMSELRKRSRVSVVPPESFVELESEGEVPTALDDRLSLLFVCAHPAIDPRMHAPLMLQAVLGVDAARIASVFLVPPSTMGQRLTRAKAKIRDAGIRYEVPDAEEFTRRLGAVLQAIYAAYGLADPTADATDERDSALREEALRLAELLTDLLPGEPEAWGLYSLLLHTESRRPARVIDGLFVPLRDQDTSRWSREQRELADRVLTHASKLARIGRFQLEAAISAIHSSRADGFVTDWESIVVLYRGLLGIAPSVGATIAAASAMIEIGLEDQAAQLLDSLPSDLVRDHQPYWVCRSRLDEARHDFEAARRAFDRAIGLTTNASVRRHLVASRPGP
jgi:RNA polymerase sigma-70 factor (ECF subfamily)